MRALAERLSKTWSRGVVGGVSGRSEKQSWWSGGNEEINVFGGRLGQKVCAREGMRGQEAVARSRVERFQTVVKHSRVEKRSLDRWVTFWR